MTLVNLDKSLHDIHRICDSCRDQPELEESAKELEVLTYEAHDRLMEEIVNSGLILEKGCLSSAYKGTETPNLVNAVLIFEKCIGAAVKMGTAMTTISRRVNPKGV